MSSDLSEKLNKEIEKESKKIGKKIAEQQVQDKLGELDLRTDKHLAGLQAKLAAGASKTGLTLLSTVYFLLTLEHIPVLAMLVLIYFFSVIVSILLLLAIIIVGCVYLFCYIIIHQFPNKLKKGSLGFAFAIVLSICEAFLVAYLCQVVDEVLLIFVLGILIIVLLVNTILARIMKSKYRGVVGVLAGIGGITGLYAIYMLVSEFDWVFVVVSYCLTVVYYTFLVLVSVRIIKFYELEEDFRAAVFVTLVVYKKKIDYTFGLVFLLGKAIFRCCKKKDNY